MNRVAKRIMAVGSVAPMALLIAAGGAGATSDFQYGQLDGGIVYATCYSDNVEGLLFDVAIDVDDSGQGADIDDVNTVRVTASNNVSVADPDRTLAGAQVSAVRIDLYRNDFSKIDDHTNAVRTPLGSASDSTSAFVNDGDVTKGLNFDNIGHAVVTVNWSATPGGGGPEVVACTVRMPSNN